jgi:hypothetical protein
VESGLVAAMGVGDEVSATGAFQRRYGFLSAMHWTKISGVRFNEIYSLRSLRTRLGLGS